MRVAVVTPYYKESSLILDRCLKSVFNQDYDNVTHYMVADGFPQYDVMRRWPAVKHIVLPDPHRNFGCTPRGVGAQCALAEGFDIVCFLDADNYFESNHVGSLVETYHQGRSHGVKLDAVFSSRTLFLPGHESLRIEAPDDERPGSSFIDTNCISIARSAGFLWGAWCQIPKSMTPICDRVFCKFMQHHGLKVSWTGKATVRYEANWKFAYIKAGLPVPTSGLHDERLDDTGLGLGEDEFWSMLRVPWVYNR